MLVLYVLALCLIVADDRVWRRSSPRGRRLGVAAAPAAETLVAALTLRFVAVMPPPAFFERNARKPGSRAVVEDRFVVAGLGADDDARPEPAARLRARFFKVN